MNWNTTKRILPLAMAAAVALVALGLMGAATYAWFSHNKRVTTDTYSSVRSATQELELGISGSSGGPFALECDINKVSLGDVLDPVSTADLKTFFANTAMKGDMATGFVATTGGYYHGQVFLRATATGMPDDAKLQIYFDSPGILVQESGDMPGLMLNAARVGLAFTNAEEDKTFIFNMSDAHNGGTDTYNNTALGGVPLTGEKVLGGSATAPAYVNDPSVDPKLYLMDTATGTTTLPEEPLIVMGLNTVVTVDVYFYIEGCDSDCTNAIRTTEMSIQLPFYGVLTEGDEG